ncbi:MAG: FlaD/FlaE family flagellar protein [Thermoplasmata archaeon]
MAIPVGTGPGGPPAPPPARPIAAPPGADEFQEVSAAAQPPGPPQAMAPMPPPQAVPRPGESYQVVTPTPELASQSTMERLDGVERTLEEAIRRIDTIDKFTEAVRNDINQVKESISHIEANMRELTSLYDLISSQVNPFIEMEAAAKAAPAVEEAAKEEVPEFDALFEPTPELAAGEEFLPVEQAPLAPPPLAPTPEGLAAPPAMETPVPGAAPGAPAAPRPERPLRVARLTQIGSDSMCLIALMRWIEFLLSKVKREQIPSLLSFYVRIGWISDGIKQHVMDVIRGIRFGPGAPVGGATGRTYAPYEAPKDREGDVVMAYSKEAVTEVGAGPEAKKPAVPLGDDWKMTPEDHLKTLIFIERIRGTEVDKSKLEELERDVLNLRKGLDGFFGL